MEKVSGRYKAKNKKSTANSKPKTAKKRKSDGPTCSMFLSELSRKWAMKRRQDEEAPKNIVQSIIESLTNALPIKFSKKSPPKSASPMRIETLQTFAPELLPNDTLDIPHAIKPTENNETEKELIRQPFQMPKMPLVNSEVIKLAVEKKKKEPMQDEAVNTGPEHDVASEIARHVNTLRKISLIAEEFNQKTAKSLKEIVDSVQEDLVKKLEQLEKEQQEKTDAVDIPTDIIEKPQIFDPNISIILEENIQ